MDEINVLVKLVRNLPEGDCGYCVQRNRRKDKYEIAISQEAHKTVAAFGSTLLHELLHLWVYIIGLYGYKVKLKYEHKFIRAVEATIIQFMEILKQGKKDKIKRKRRKK